MTHYCQTCKKPVQASGGRHVIIEEPEKGRIRTRWCRGPIVLAQNKLPKPELTGGLKGL